MKRTTQLAILAIPLLLFAFGWHLRGQVDRQRWREREQLLEERFALVGSGATVEGDPEQTVNLALLWSVWRLLQRHYVDPAQLEVDKLRFGAIAGLVRAVGDPYTVFMTPKESRDFAGSLKGTLQGIGAELQLRDNLIVVVSPLRGSPAAKAGLLPKDVILEVDGTSVEGLSLEEVVARVRGPRGTQVTLTIARASRSVPLSFTITRDDIRIPTVDRKTYRLGEETVAVVAVNQFGEKTIPDLRRILEDLSGEEHRGLVLDLRSNGGGYLDGAVEMSSFFLSSGKVVTVERQGVDPNVHYVLGRPPLPALPLVVLINGGSASAAEIVAGALQDTGRATVLGEQSFGKGTVQEVMDLPGGSALRVTTAQWVTPSGRDIGSEGIAPDIAVPLTEADIAAERDVQLHAAVRLLVTGERDPAVLASTGSTLVVEEVPKE